jgi:methionine-rich copper-binding protein CopC
MRILPALAAVSLLAVAGPALAHAKLVASTPADNATVAPTSSIELQFSETLVDKLSTAELGMTEMGGMKMTTPMKMPLTATLGADHKTLKLVSAKPLARGVYKLDWHATATDTHRSNGSISFTVK